MDDKLYFNEKDADMVIEFLNQTAKKMEFKQGFDIPQCVEYHKLLAFMQTVVIPKMKSNIFEFKEYIKNKEELPELPKEE